MEFCRQLMCLLLITFVFQSVFVYSTKEIVVQVNTKKLPLIVSERFLSMSVDPQVLVDSLPMSLSSQNMIRGLSPMFIRVGGANSNKVQFGKSSQDNATLTEKEWMAINELASNTGTDIIMSLNAMQRIGKVWDSKNSLEMISFSHNQMYEVGWQLGYSIENLQGMSAADLGRDAVRLRKILDAFPHYTRAPILAPDVILSHDYAHIIKEFIKEAGSSLSALPVQMTLARESDSNVLQTGGLSQSELDSIIWSNQWNGKQMVRKPIWIGESELSSGNMSDTIAWMSRLGVAAKAGYQVVMRKLNPNLFSTPTADYWVSLLYKHLVGREVLETRVLTGNRPSVQIFSHCTPVIPQDSSVLDSPWNYEKGAITIFGINKGIESVKLTLRVSIKEETMHIYSITADERNPESPTVYMNGQGLALSPIGELPVLSPRVKKASRYLTVSLAPRSVFFLVLPDSKVRTCVSPTVPHPPDLQELAKRLRLDGGGPDNFERTEASTFDSVLEPRVYVSFAKKRGMDYNKKAETISDPEKEAMSVRYVMFNDNSWFNKFADSVRQGLPPGEAIKDDELTETLTKDNLAMLKAAILDATSDSKSVQQQRTKRDTSDHGKPTKVSDIFRMGKLYREEHANEDKSKEGLPHLPGVPSSVMEELKHVQVECKLDGECSKHAVDTQETTTTKSNVQKIPMKNLRKRRSARDSGEGTVRQYLEDLTEEGERLMETIDDSLSNNTSSLNNVGQTSPESKSEVPKPEALVDNSVPGLGAEEGPSTSTSALQSMIKENLANGSPFELGIATEEPQQMANTEHPFRVFEEGITGKDGETPRKATDQNTPLAPASLGGLSGLPPLDLAIFRTGRVQERLASFRQHLLRSRQELLRLGQKSGAQESGEKARNVLGGLPSLDWGSLMKPRLKRSLFLPEFPLFPEEQLGENELYGRNLARRRLQDEDCDYQEPYYFNPHYNPQGYMRPERQYESYYAIPDDGMEHYHDQHHHHHHDDEDEENLEENYEEEEGGDYERELRDLMERQAYLGPQLYNPNPLSLHRVPLMRRRKRSLSAESKDDLSKRIDSFLEKNLIDVEPEAPSKGLREKLQMSQEAGSLFELAQKYNALLDKEATKERPKTDVLSIKGKDSEEEWLENVERITRRPQSKKKVSKYEEAKNTSFVFSIIMDRIKYFLSLFQKIMNSSDK